MKWEADVLLWIQDNLRNAVLDPICKVFGWIGAHGELAIVVALDIDDDSLRRRSYDSVPDPPDQHTTIPEEESPCETDAINAFSGADFFNA